MQIFTTDLLISGRFWILKCLLFVSIIALFFTTSPAIFVNNVATLPPAYELKSVHPFADTSTLTIPEAEGERSHGAKLTPRIFGSILLYLANICSLNPYTPATIFGVIFLLSGILSGYQITGDRLIGLLLGLTISGLYASSTCFSINFMPKPFDGIAIGLLGLTLISMRRLWLLAIFSFLSCWTDERSILSLFIIALFVVMNSQLDNKAKYNRILILFCSVIFYILTRLLLSYFLAWKNPDMGMIGLELDKRQMFLFFPLAAWTCFKGGWITIFFSACTLFNQRAHIRLLLLIGTVVLMILSCVLVIDVSRAGSFAFPLIPLSYLIVRDKLALHEFRMVAGAGALISLIAPNFEILLGIKVKWLPSLQSLILSM